MSIMKQYTVILPDVIQARSEQAAWDVFLDYVGECHRMGDITCFDFVEVIPPTDIGHPLGEEIHIPEGHIFKAAGLYLCEWPDEWTEAELLAAIRNEDYENITVCHAHELQPWEDIAEWIEDAARVFSV